MNQKNDDSRVKPQPFKDTPASGHDRLSQEEEQCLFRIMKRLGQNLVCLKSNLGLYLSLDYLINKTENWQIHLSGKDFFTIAVTKLKKMHSCTSVRETKPKTCSSSQTSMRDFCACVF